MTLPDPHLSELHAALDGHAQLVADTEGEDDAAAAAALASLPDEHVPAGPSGMADDDDDE